MGEVYSWANAPLEEVQEDVRHVLLELGFDVRVYQQHLETIEFSTSSVWLNVARRGSLRTTTSVAFIVTLDEGSGYRNVGWELVEPAELSRDGFCEAFLIALEDIRTSLRADPPGVELSKSERASLAAFYDAMALIDDYGALIAAQQRRESKGEKQ